MEEARTPKLGDWSAPSTAALTTSVSLQPGRGGWVVSGWKSRNESCVLHSSSYLFLPSVSSSHPFLLPHLPSFFLSLSPSPPPRSPILPSSHVPHQPPLPAASPFPGPSTSTTSPTATQWDQGEQGDTEGELLCTSFPRPLAVSENKRIVNYLSPFSSSLYMSTCISYTPISVT